MGSGLLRRSFMIFTASLVFAVGFSCSAYAAAQSGGGGVRPAGHAPGGSGQASPAAVMLGNTDLPAALQFQVIVSGRLTAKRAQMAGLPVNHLAWVRDWVSRKAGVEVTEVAARVATPQGGQAQVASFNSTLLKKGLIKESIAGPLRFAAFRAPIRIGGAAYVELYLALARGSYVFVLRVYAPSRSLASANSLLGHLAAAQWRKAPSSASAAGPARIDTAQAAGFVVGSLGGYLAIVTGIAYWRNPLRRARRRERSQPPRPWPDGFGVVDVSTQARQSRGTAVRRLVVQMAGLGVAAYGADVFLVRYWYVYLVIGLAMVWAGGRFIRPAGAARGVSSGIVGGTRRFRVAAMRSVASALVLLGLISVVIYALSDQQPQSAVIRTGSSTAPVQSVGAAFGAIGFMLLIVGAVISRFARRAGSIDARRLMLRDPRPPVLYLRSFGDDRLKLLTATLGRPSLIERFTPRRSDAFEEVLVRHLSCLGPVIAVNPPDTRLAPLGAARETISSSDWQSAVATWMEQSARIVFVAPPGGVTDGLRWELQTVSATKQWHKTLIVIPPVPGEELQRRWQGFADAGATLWPLALLVPVEDPDALVLAFQHSRWTAIIADRRTEWSYGAALSQALAGTSEPAQAVPSGPVQAVPSDPG